MSWQSTSEKMRIREKQADITNGEDSPFITMDRQVWLDYADEVKKIEEALTEQLCERGYAFRGRCDTVPEDIERAFNALGICTEEHRATLEEKR